MSWPARYPKTAIVIVAALAILSAALALRLRPDVSMQSLFSSDDPAAKALGHVLNEFPAADELLVLTTLPDRSANAAPDIDRLLAFAERLDKGVREDASASSLVASLQYRADRQSFEFFEKIAIPSGLLYLTSAELIEVKHRLTEAEMAKQLQQNEAMLSMPGPAAGALSKVLLQDPLRLREFLEQRLVAARPTKTYQNRDAFLSPDGRSLLIRIAGKKPLNDPAFSREITTVMTRLVDRANVDHLGIDISGGYPIASHSERSIRSDSISGVFSTVLFLGALFLLVYRRGVRLFHLAMAPVVIGTLYGFGILSLFSGKLTPLTGVIGGMLAGIGIDYPIYFLAHYNDRRRDGELPAAAVLNTWRHSGGALLAAWVTSVVGFLAISLSSVRALRDFAVLGSLGLAGTLIVTIILLPALLVLLDRQSVSPEASIGMRFSTEPLLRWIDRWARTLVIVTGGMLVIWLAVTVANGSLLDLEPDLTVMHPRPNPPLDAQSRISRQMSSAPGALIMHLQSDSPQKLLSLAHRVQDRLRMPGASLAGVQTSFGLASLLPDPQQAAKNLTAIASFDVNRVLADFDAAIEKSSFDAKAYEPYKFFLRRLLATEPAPGVRELMPYRQLASAMLPRTRNENDVPTQAIILVFVNRSLDVRSDRDATITQIRAILSDVPGATLTGMPVLGHDTETTIHRDLPRLIGASLLVVGLYLIVHFRSFRDAALAALPTLFSLSCLAFVLTSTGQQLNLVNTVSIPLLIGVDVDYGIFLVTCARRTKSADELLKQYEAGTEANLMCCACTLLGFGSLVFTSVPAVRSLGWAVAIGITSCAAGTLLLLLPLMLWQRRAKERRAAKS